MSWEPLHSPKARGLHYDGPVVLSVTQEMDGQRMWLLVSTEFARDRLGWASGDFVSTLVGKGEDAGRIMFFKSALYAPRKLQQQGKNKPRLRLRISPPDCVDANVREGRVVAHKITDFKGATALKATIPESWRC